MNAYTIILLAICVLRIGLALGQHGQTEVIEHDFKETLMGQLLAILLILKATNLL